MLDNMDITQATAKFPKESDTIVHLNVGGARFTATVKTLTEHSGWFKALTRPSGSKLPLMDDGKTFFIDRDGSIFGDLLGFMRSGDLTAGSGFAGLVRARLCLFSRWYIHLLFLVANSCKCKSTHSPVQLVLDGRPLHIHLQKSCGVAFRLLVQSLIHYMYGKMKWRSNS